MSLTDEGEQRSGSAGEDFEDAFQNRDAAAIANEVEKSIDEEHEDSNNEADGNKIVSGSPKTNDRLLKEKSVSVIIIKFKHSSADINRFVAENTVSRTI